MHIVKFKDGTYGIRKLTLLGYRYKDLISREAYWWDISSEHFNDCKHESLEKVQKFLNRLTDKGTRQWN